MKRSHDTSIDNPILKIFDNNINLHIEASTLAIRSAFNSSTELRGKHSSNLGSCIAGELRGLQSTEDYTLEDALYSGSRGLIVPGKESLQFLKSLMQDKDNYDALLNNLGIQDYITPDIAHNRTLFLVENYITNSRLTPPSSRVESAGARIAGAKSSSNDGRGGMEVG